MVLEHYKTELELAQHISKLEAQVKGYKALCERLQAQADEMRSGRAIEQRDALLAALIRLRKDAYNANADSSCNEAFETADAAIDAAKAGAQ